MISDPSEPEGVERIGLELVQPAPRSSASSSDANPASPTRPTSEAVSNSGSGDRLRLPLWLFVAGLILMALVIGWQAQNAGELEAQVVGLEVELERTNGLLEAHRTHLSEIRGGVEDLSERLQGLRALVESDPIQAESAGESDGPGL